MLISRLLLIAAFLGAGACATDSFARETSAARCTMIFRVSRDTSATYVLARSTADTVLAGAGTMIYGMPPRPGRRPPEYYGQIVRAQRIEGKDADAIRRALRRQRSNDIVVVPQSYGMGCGPEAWWTSVVFTQPNADGVFKLKAWPESLWIGGRPTFYAPLAQMETYADGPHVRGPKAVVRSPADSNPLPNLSALEYLDMLMALPNGWADSAAFPRLYRWIDAHPRVRSRFPANFALQGYPESMPRKARD